MNIMFSQAYFSDTIEKNGIDNPPKIVTNEISATER